MSAKERIVVCVDGLLALSVWFLSHTKFMRGSQEGVQDQLQVVVISINYGEDPENQHASG